jgi:hypothetical protein
MSLNETEEINVFLKRVNTDGRGLYWIGLSDQKIEGKFVWSSTNEVSEYTNWRTGEPNDSKSDEDCVHLVLLLSATINMR